MRLNDSIHLTYCLNIHPGETWAEQRRAIAEEACAVKGALAPDRPFGLGLRFGRLALNELAAPAARSDLRDLLAARGLYAFTLNAFPYGPFHGQPVKTNVYTPDWSQRDRLDYTLSAIDLLAALLPEGVEGSISTVPIAYREPALPADRLARACEHLAETAFAMSAVEQRTGRLLHLGLEPEPDCLLENTAESIAFFERSFLPRGADFLQRQHGLTAPQAEQTLRRHIGICLDTCHLALQFESPTESIKALHRHGIRISKVQLSAALQAETTPQAAKALAPFARDGVYLHQVKILQSDGTLRAWPDLTPERLAAWNAQTPARPCRIHFHVPLDFTTHDGLTSTTALLTPDFYATAVDCGVTHFEIETYTFAVLPPALRRRTLVDNLIAEYRQVLGTWK